MNEILAETSGKDWLKNNFWFLMTENLPGISQKDESKSIFTSWTDNFC